MKKIKKKTETKKEIEERVRKEEKESNFREKKRNSHILFMGIFGAIIGIIFVSVKYPYATTFGIIGGAITGGLIGAAIGDHTG